MQTALGFGVGFRPKHYRQVTLEKPKSVDWFEIISENFMATGGRPKKFLEELRSHYPIVMHGVGLSIASFDPLDIKYLAMLKQLADRIDPPIISDHLCWTTHSAHNSHDLLPIIFNEESLKHVVERVDQVQEFLGRRFYLENPSSYVDFAAREMSEGEFFKELCARTGCGVLLDLNNLYVNQRNLGQDPKAFIDSLGANTVGQFHLAGHTNRGDVLIDTHDGYVCDPVWDLYKVAAKKWPKAPTLIEWDDKIPEFEELVSESNKARKFHNEALKSFNSFAPKVDPSISKHIVENKINNLEIHQNFIAMVTRQMEDGPSAESLNLLAKDCPVDAAIGIDVYNQAYFLRIKDCLKEFFPSIAFICGEHGFSDLVVNYLGQFKPHQISIKYVGEEFASFILSSASADDYGVPRETLSDIARIEWAKEDIFDAEDDLPALDVQILREVDDSAWETAHFRFIGAMRFNEIGCSALKVIEAIAAGNAPEKPDFEPYFYLTYRHQNEVRTLQLEETSFKALKLMHEGKTFKQTCQTLNLEDESALVELTRHLCSWFELGLVTDLQS